MSKERIQALVDHAKSIAKSAEEDLKTFGYTDASKESLEFAHAVAVTHGDPAAGEPPATCSASCDHVFPPPEPKTKRRADLRRRIRGAFAPSNNALSAKQEELLKTMRAEYLAEKAAAEAEQQRQQALRAQVLRTSAEMEYPNRRRVSFDRTFRETGGYVIEQDRARLAEEEADLERRAAEREAERAEEAAKRGVRRADQARLDEYRIPGITGRLIDDE